MCDFCDTEMKSGSIILNVVIFRPKLLLEIANDYVLQELKSR